MFCNTVICSNELPTNSADAEGVRCSKQCFHVSVHAYHAVVLGQLQAGLALEWAGQQAIGLAFVGQLQ